MISFRHVYFVRHVCQKWNWNRCDLINSELLFSSWCQCVPNWHRVRPTPPDVTCRDQIQCLINTDPVKPRERLQRDGRGRLAGHGSVLAQQLANREIRVSWTVGRYLSVARQTGNAWPRRDAPTEVSGNIDEDSKRSMYAWPQRHASAATVSSSAATETYHAMNLTVLLSLVGYGTTARSCVRRQRPTQNYIAPNNDTMCDVDKLNAESEWNSVKKIYTIAKLTL